MSNLKPSMVGLDSGLNLQVAKIAAPIGSVLDTLNYEQVDFQGQKRIDGYTRYDGGASASIYDYLVIRVPWPDPEEEEEEETSNLWDMEPPYSVFSAKGLFGTVAVRTSNSIASEFVLLVVVTDYNNLPVEGDQIFVQYTSEGVEYGEGDSYNYEGTVSSVVWGKNSNVTPEEHTANILEIGAALRSTTTSVPGPIAGLHWFRDRLYAVAGVVYISLEGTTPVIHPGDMVSISGDPDGITARVLDSFTLQASRAVFIDTMYPDYWEPGNFSLYDSEGSYLGTSITEYEALPVNEIASMFEARTDKQVFDEDVDGEYKFGWLFKHLGWKVFFKDGNAPYGRLTALNQNIEDTGVQGPTSTEGNNGAPSVVTQSISITNLPTQVKGWKSYSSNTTYNLTPSDIHNTDNEAIYADAYISWNGSSGAVVGDTGSLTEYSPTNTIRISS